MCSGLRIATREGASQLWKGSSTYELGQHPGNRAVCITPLVGEMATQQGQIDEHPTYLSDVRTCSSIVPKSMGQTDRQTVCCV